jgi:hypothetical protein
MITRFLSTLKNKLHANYLTKEKSDITIKTCDIERKKKIKYLGVFIDEHLQWDEQLQHIQNKIAKNTGVINKLRHFVSIQMLKQLY